MAENIHFPFDLIITEGDDRTFTMSFADPNGNATDISSWDFFYTAKSSTSDLDVGAVLRLEPSDFSKSGAPTVDTITATLRLADGPVLPGIYQQDLQIKVSSDITTIGRGQLEVEAEVTKREA